MFGAHSDGRVLKTVSICALTFLIGPTRNMGAVDHVRGEVSHGAVGISAGAPCGRGIGVCEKILGMFSAKESDVSDYTFFDELMGKLCRGGADVVENPPDWLGLRFGPPVPLRLRLQGSRPMVFRRARAFPV